MTESTLESAFDFTPDELRCNKSGVLSNRQRSRVQAYAAINRKGRKFAQIAFGLTAICFSLPPLFLQGPGFDQAFPFLAGFSAAIWSLFGAVAGVTYLKSRDLAQGKINEIEGSVSLWQKEVQRHSVSLGTAYFIKLGGRTYQLESPEQAKALKTGQSYRFYFVPNGRVPIILSVVSL